MNQKKQRLCDKCFDQLTGKSEKKIAKSKKEDKKLSPPSPTKSRVTIVEEPEDLNASLESKKEFKALQDYIPERDTDLGFKKGDIITVTKRSKTIGWWEGTVNGKKGKFPKDYIQDLGEESKSQRKTKKVDLDVVVVQAYSESNSLELKEGAIVHVSLVDTHTDGEDWYFGKNRETGKSGWFPSGQVTVLDTEGDDSDSGFGTMSPSSTAIDFHMNSISVGDTLSQSLSSPRIGDYDSQISVSHRAESNQANHMFLENVSDVASSNQTASPTRSRRALCASPDGQGVRIKSKNDKR